MQRLEVSGAVRALYGSLCVKGLITSFFFCRNHAVRKIMWKKYCRAGQATGDNIIRRMRFAFSITKATNTHSEYVMHFFSPPVQQLLHEIASMLRHTYSACLVQC